jgi:hypothetical protein
VTDADRRFLILKSGRILHQILDNLRSGFIDDARKNHRSIDTEQSRYVTLLDMDELTFRDRYGLAPRPWPEATATEN